MIKKNAPALIILLLLLGCSAETIDDVEPTTSGNLFDGSGDVQTNFVNVGSSFIHISHSAPTGSYSITQDSTTKNWIFKTSSDYSGSDGPSLFFYISKENYDSTVSASDQRYVNSEMSAVLHTTAVSSNNGQLTYEILNSSTESILDYKTIILWCESAETIFYIAEVLPL